MVEFIATITSKLGASFCIGLLCGVPVAILTGAGFWDSTLGVTFLFMLFGSTN